MNSYELQISTESINYLKYHIEREHESFIYLKKKTKIIFRILQSEALYLVPFFPDTFPSFTLPLLSSPQIPRYSSNPTSSAKVFLSSPPESNLYIFHTNIFYSACVLFFNMWVMSWLTDGSWIWKIKVQVLDLHLFTLYIRIDFCCC